MLKRWLLCIPHIKWPLEEKLSVADVGATGGIEHHWRAAFSECEFYTFDPDPRAEKISHSIGLWSEPCIKKLNLAKNPVASSIYSFNIEELKYFFDHEDLVEVGAQMIQLDTLDRKVKSLDFIKIDAEGAELEILKGAKSHLQNHCLGLQVEVSFCKRYQEGPLFADIDQYLRDLDFQVIQIYRSHWIRKNRLFNLTSSPQLIWGNALFLLSKQALFSKIQKAETPLSILKKYILILLIYRLYDYAEDICHEVIEKKLIDEITIRSLQKLIRKNLSSNIGCFFQVSLAFFIGLGALCLLFPISKLRRKSLFLVRERLKQLGTICISLARFEETVCDFE